MADELWGDADGIKNKTHNFGKGMVINGMNMQEAFDLIKVVPDFKTSTSTPLFIHRQLKDGAVYFISNPKDEAVSFRASFRISGKKPELWDAVTGTVRELPSFIQSEGLTSIPIQLPANGSAFIVFRKDGSASDTTKSNFPLPVKSLEITGPWTVVFKPEMRGPEKPQIFTTLTDWSLHTNDSIKYYSGAADYQKTFSLKKVENGLHYLIDLGIARDIAKVSVNGIEVGGCWTPPYQLDITKALKTGENKLEIKVVNTWKNRLIGDALLPEGQRSTSTLFRPDPNSGTTSSGLLGPVRINLMRY